MFWEAASRSEACISWKFSQMAAFPRPLRWRHWSRSPRRHASRTEFSLAYDIHGHFGGLFIPIVSLGAWLASFLNWFQSWRNSSTSAVSRLEIEHANYCSIAEPLKHAGFILMDFLSCGRILSVSLMSAASCQWSVSLGPSKDGFQQDKIRMWAKACLVLLSGLYHVHCLAVGNWNYTNLYILFIFGNALTDWFLKSYAMFKFWGNKSHIKNYRFFFFTIVNWLYSLVMI